MKRKKAIVSVSNDLFTDQRVHKVCMFLVEHEFEVTLLGRFRKHSQPIENRPYQTKRFKLIADKGALFYAALNLRLFLYLLTHKADVLVSNDLDTLLANYAASKFKGSTKLVYDSHEMFTEVPELQNRKTVRNIWKGIEAWILPRIKYRYTVNESIANYYQNLYHLKFHVVRNVAPKWNPSDIASKAALGIPEQKFIVILQGAGINVDRGAEEAIEAITKIQDTVLLIVGDGDVIPDLKEKVKANGYEDQVCFYGKRPYQEMMQYTHHADLGLSFDKPNNPNYINSLPNKIFDYIHAQTPVISSNIKEIRHIIETYQVGEIVEEHSIENLKTVIEKLKNNPSYLEQLKNNCASAANALSWENELEQLKKIYEV